MKKNTNRRGFTLTELAVVLAVLGIVSAMVVSFTVSVNGSRQLSSARLDAMSDVGVAESFVNDFIERNGGVVADEGKSIKADGKTLTLVDNNDGGKNLVVKIGENTETSITLTNVTGISFKSLSGNNGDVIYFVTLTFKVLEKAETYTFCVNPFVGEGGN